MSTARLALTPAELRLLPYLQTHLTAGGIAERLFVSSHTVRAEVKSIYRKLGVCSRQDAVQIGHGDRPARRFSRTVRRGCLGAAGVAAAGRG